MALQGSHRQENMSSPPSQEETQAYCVHTGISLLEPELRDGHGY